MRRWIISAAVGALGLGLAGAANATGGKGDKTSEQQETKVEKKTTKETSSTGSIDTQEVEKVMGADAKIIDLSVLDKQQLMTLQRELSNRGYYQGKIDGTASATTKAALQQFLDKRYEMSKKLLDQNKVPGEIATALGLNVNEIQPVRGEDLGKGKTGSPSDEPVPMDEPTPSPDQPESKPY